MSKIALSGNASGTGTFTIASPNSNSDRTVNLPDAGGDMVLTTATQTLTNKTFSGAQGFGTASLAEPTGTAPLYMCRAWVNFDGTTSPGTIRASGNVSSVTKHSTGDYTVNLTTAMPDTNFTGQVSISGAVIPGVAHVSPYLGAPGLNDTSATPNASSFRVSAYLNTGSGSRADPALVCVSIFR
jgi:hypothetical protein